MEIKQEVLNELIRIRRKALPNESCAILFKDNTLVFELEPASKSMGHFSDVDPIYMDELCQEHGNPSALFHSHPCEAYPSSTDYMYMSTTIPFWGCIWIIMSDREKIRAFTLVDKRVKEIPITVF